MGGGGVRSSTELSWRRQLKRLCPRPIRWRRHLILLAVCTAHSDEKERTEKLYSQGVINDGARACHRLLLQRDGAGPATATSDWLGLSPVSVERVSQSVRASTSRLLYTTLARLLLYRSA
jgi:hypothetical protein